MLDSGEIKVRNSWRNSLGQFHIIKLADRVKGPGELRRAFPFRYSLIFVGLSEDAEESVLLKGTASAVP